jgi:hypothetical protein
VPLGVQGKQPGIGKSLVGAAAPATAAKVRTSAIIANNFFIERVASRDRVKINCYEPILTTLGLFSRLRRSRFR